MQLKDDGGKALIADIPSRESCTPTAYVLKVSCCLYHLKHISAGLHELRQYHCQYRYCTDAQNSRACSQASHAQQTRTSTTAAAGKRGCASSSCSSSLNKQREWQTQGQRQEEEQTMTQFLKDNITKTNEAMAYFLLTQSASTFTSTAKCINEMNENMMSWLVLKQFRVQKTCLTLGTATLLSYLLLAVLE